MVLYNQENDDTESMNQVINKIKNILNSIKKVYSLLKIEKYLIKEIERVDKETDSETLIEKNQWISGDTRYARYREFENWTTIGRTIDRMVKKNKKNRTGEHKYRNKNSTRFFVGMLLISKCS